MGVRDEQRPPRLREAIGQGAEYRRREGRMPRPAAQQADEGGRTLGGQWERAARRRGGSAAASVARDPERARRREGEVSQSGARRIDGPAPDAPPQDEIQSDVVFGTVVAFVVGCRVSVNVAFEIAYTMYR